LLGAFDVPEISRFFGIVIRMFTEAGARHQSPHFHAFYQDQVAVFGIDPVDLLTGEMPRRQQRLIEAWAELHNPELQADWKRLQEGRPALPIDPLN
jgi:hypothetical protein